MIKVENISFEYKKSKGKQFDDFSLSLGKGKVCGLLGKNGVGKSTLLYLMTGLLLPKNGSVYLKGVNVAKRLPKHLVISTLYPKNLICHLLP